MSRIFGAIAACASLAVLAIGHGLATAQPSEVPSADSVAETVDVTQVDAIGLTGFSGTYGTAHTGPAGGFNDSAFPDPDGVTEYVTITGPKQAQTSGVNLPMAYDARTDLVALTARLTPSGEPLLAMAELHTYARCAPPHEPQTLVAITDPRLLGEPMTPGEPVVVEVTGEQPGLPAVDHGTLTGVLQTVEDNTGTTDVEVRPSSRSTETLTSFSTKGRWRPWYSATYRPTARQSRQHLR